MLPWMLGGGVLAIGWAVLKLRRWGLFRRSAPVPATPPADTGNPRTV
jgi:hypothetical protein